MSWVVSVGRSWQKKTSRKGEGEERRKRRRENKKRKKEKEKRRGMRKGGEGKEKRRGEQKRKRGENKKGGSFDLSPGRPAAAARQHAIGTGRQHKLKGGCPLRGVKT